MSDLHVVLLSGGSGTRLWPLSNSARSKQFLKVLPAPGGGRESMVQRTLRMLAAHGPACDVTVATCASQAEELARQAPGADAVVEPERRDTAPAIMLACAHLAWERGAVPSDPVVVMPIDAFADEGYYERLADLARAAESGEADLVLMGVEPAYPSAKYGYIVPAARVGDVWRVHSFVEKPSEEGAAGLIAMGALWNCGVFAFRLGYLTSLISSYGDFGSLEDLRSHYSELPKNSFDYEVVEKASSVAVVPFAGTWKDLGTWNTLAEEMADAVSGRVEGAETCENTTVVNELGLPLVALGLRDAVVVAAPDGVLVSDKAASSHMKPHVERAAEGRPMRERRRWGEYRVVDSSAYPDGSRSLTKELLIRDGSQLSYQRHARRSEVWTVACGAGEVVLDGGVRPVGPGSVVQIAPGQMHAARAVGSDLHVIEVQLGEELVEGDIERFGNYWED